MQTSRSLYPLRMSGYQLDTELYNAVARLNRDADQPEHFVVQMSIDIFKSNFDEKRRNDKYWFRYHQCGSEIRCCPPGNLSINVCARLIFQSYGGSGNWQLRLRAFNPRTLRMETVWESIPFNTRRLLIQWIERNRGYLLSVASEKKVT